jgi:hypothetical protein
MKDNTPAQGEKWQIWKLKKKNLKIKNKSISPEQADQFKFFN